MAKLLVVDDSEIVRLQLRDAFEADRHQVFEAGDGKEALDVIETNQDIQIVFCDVNMPVMDGLTMCNNLRKDERFRDIKIIMLTTESSPDLKAKGKEIGILAWITKPFEAKHISSLIAKILAK